MARSKRDRNAKTSSSQSKQNATAKEKNQPKIDKPNGMTTSSNTTIAAALADYSKRAAKLKGEIGGALERQANLEILKENDSRNSEQIEQLEQTLKEFDNTAEGANKHEDVTSARLVEPQVSSLKRLDSDNQSNQINLEPDQRSIAEAATEEKIFAGEQDRRGALFEPLNAQLDPDSKCSLLLASIKRHVNDNDKLSDHLFKTPSLVSDLLDPLCRKLVELGDSRRLLESELDSERSRRFKLEKLCRELQKSNNSIRIESLDLIQAEQKRAKEQSGKIQETLAGVMKLFNENQQRNVAICKENRDLQDKLVNLLEHCGNWEKSVESALKEKELAIKLAKTQVAKSELLRHEEKESWLEQKRDYLQIISLLQQKQTVMEQQSEKLKRELFVNMEKYESFHKLVGEKTIRFQRESKVLFDRMEKSSKEHKSMVDSYEHLLNENKKWVKVNELSAKKIEALEKLCRTLRNGGQVDNKEQPAIATDTHLNLNLQEPSKISIKEQRALEQKSAQI